MIRDGHGRRGGRTRTLLPRGGVYEVTDTSGSVWRTKKPYVVVAILGVGVIVALWWWNDQSPFAAPRDGTYTCELVEIGSDGKYTRMTNATGGAEVSDGKVTSVDAAGANLALSEVTVQPRGTAHFRIFEGEVGALANPVGSAIACFHLRD